MSGMIFSSCHDITVGFLETGEATYSPDVFEVRKTLTDTINPWDSDYKRNKYKADWVSPPLQGYKGTAPMFIKLKEVKSPNGGNVEIFMQEVTLRGNGAVVIPFNNNIPLGEYIISLNISNEGYENDLNDIFTVVVKEK